MDRWPGVAEIERANDCCRRCFECSGFPYWVRRMIVCPECGNKRCPKATNHRNTCTGSNDPEQQGSAYSSRFIGI